MKGQTRWGIDLVQQENKQKAYEDQKDMREVLKKFVFNCSVYDLQKMYERMKELKKWKQLHVIYWEKLKKIIIKKLLFWK